MFRADMLFNHRIVFLLLDLHPPPPLPFQQEEGFSLSGLMSLGSPQLCRVTELLASARRLPVTLPLL
jgi:hypothetical protein